MTSPRPVVAAFLAFRFCRSLYFHIAILVPFFLSKGLDLSDVFLLESVYFFAKVLFDVPSGLIADRLNKRLCIASSGFLASGGYCLVATGSSFEIFLLAQIILGISVALFSGADTTAMLDQIQRSDRQHLYSRVESWGGALRHLGFGTAAIIGGFVAVYWAPSITWGLSSIAMFTAGCIGLTFPQNPPGKTEAGQLGNKALIVATLQYLHHDKFVFGVMVLFAGIYSLVRLGLYFMQPIVGQLGVDLSANGLLFAGAIALSIFTSIKCARLFPISHLRRAVLILALFGGIYPAAWAVAVSANTPLLAWAMFAVGYVIYGVLQGLFEPLQRIWIAQRIPSAFRTTLLSSGSVAANLLFSIVGPIAGYGAETLGLPVILYLISGFYLLVLLMSGFLVMRESDKGLLAPGSPRP